MTPTPHTQMAHSFSVRITNEVASLKPSGPENKGDGRAKSGRSFGLSCRKKNDKFGVALAVSEKDP